MPTKGSVDNTPGKDEQLGSACFDKEDKSFSRAIPIEIDGRIRDPSLYVDNLFKIPGNTDDISPAEVFQTLITISLTHLRQGRHVLAGLSKTVGRLRIPYAPFNTTQSGFFI